MNKNFNNNYMENLPINVLAEPTFKTEEDAYIHYASKFNIEDIQDDALLYENFKSIPVLKKQRTATHRSTENKYLTRVKELANQYLIKEGTTESAEANDEVLKPYELKAEEYMQNQFEVWCKFKDKVFDAFSRIPLLVAVDTGKHNTKVAYMIFDIIKGAYTEIITDIFESRVTKVDSLSKAGLTKFTKIDGQDYLISKEADRVCYDIVSDVVGRTKAHEFHRVLLAEALRKVRQATSRSLFNVVVGISVDSLTADDGAAVYLTMLNKHPQGTEEFDSLPPNAKKDYVRKLMHELINDYTGTTYKLEYGSEKFDIVINDLLVAPETQSGSYSLGGIDFESEEYYNTYIVDIGGLNRTILPIIGRKPLTDALDTDYLGMSYIIKEATKHLIRAAADYREGGTIDRAFVERSIKFYTIKDENEAKEEELEIDDFLFEYFDKLTNSLRAMEGCAFNRQTGKLIFIGGGSHSLKPFIETYYKDHYPTNYKVEVIDDALYANVLGMYYFGETRFADRIKDCA